MNLDPILVKYLHVLSSTVVFGTGIGTAFYLLVTSLSGDARVVAAVARWVVVADWCFTATTMVLQPLTGLYLAHRLGLPLSTPWLTWSLLAFVLAALCWLPVVWLQVRLRDIATAAAVQGSGLPRLYHVYFRCWVALGVPALALFLAIFFMMVAHRLPFA